MSRDPGMSAAAIQQVIAALFPGLLGVELLMMESKAAPAS